MTNILDRVKISTEQPKVSSQLKSMRPGGLGHETKQPYPLVKGIPLTFPSRVLGNLLVNYCLYGLQLTALNETLSLKSLLQIPISRRVQASGLLVDSAI